MPPSPAQVRINDLAAPPESINPSLGGSKDFQFHVSAVTDQEDLRQMSTTSGPELRLLMESEEILCAQVLRIPYYPEQPA